jgi:hypothetical protein
MPKIFLPDLIDIYARLIVLMAKEDIPLPHRIEIASVSGLLKYYVRELTKDVNVEVTE